MGATEGINVLVEKKNGDGKWAYGLSCIEYTEFDKFGIADGPLSEYRYCVMPLSCKREIMLMSDNIECGYILNLCLICLLQIPIQIPDCFPERKLHKIMGLQEIFIICQ